VKNLPEWRHNDRDTATDYCDKPKTEIDDKLEASILKNLVN
jgi:hypothetical protein